MNARGSVLVIDDDADVREAVTAALEMDGYRVLNAPEGRSALALLRGGARPDVILLDMMMPVMDGWGFRAEQRKSPAIAGIPVLVFTAFNVPDAALEALDAAGRVAKPVKLDALLEAVSRASGLRAA